MRKDMQKRSVHDARAVFQAVYGACSGISGVAIRDADLTAMQAKPVLVSAGSIVA